MIPGLYRPDGIPGGLSTLEARELHRLLPGPTLLELPGRREPPLFTAVLQHGNETVGWDAVRRLLAEYRERELPRSWCIFIGNVAAARHGLRRLDEQPDFNRSWPGSRGPATDVHRMLDGLTAYLRQRRPIASVDVHNNTGRNPHYAVVNALRPETLNLAALFSRTALHFTIPNGVQSATFEALCPSVTVECGIVGNENGVDHATRFLDACLHLEHLPDHPPRAEDLRLYETTARLTVPAEVGFGFDDPRATLNLAPDLDALNFHELPAGTRLAFVTPGGQPPVRAHDLDGRDVTGRYLAVRNGALVTTRALTPSMLTRDLRVIRQDCLGYFMEPVPVAGPS